MSGLQNLVDMFAKGGLEISTFGEGDGSDSGRPLIRTVIQPNANVITWVQPGVDNPDAWQEHYGKLHEQIQSIRNIRQIINYSSLIVIVAFVAIFNLLLQDLVDLVVRLAVSITGAYLLRLSLRLIVRQYIRRQINKYLSPR